MVNFFRLSKYFMAYIVILLLSAAIAVGGLLRPIDLFVYKKLYLNSQSTNSINNNITIEDKIIFVELPENDAEGNFLGVEFLRGEIVNLLDTISTMIVPDEKMKPPKVILDISFSNNPTKLEAIKNAINRLKGIWDTEVYGVYDLLGAGDSFQSHDAQQAQLLYNEAFSGERLNTKFNTHGIGILSYDSFELIGTEPIPSLPIKVVNDVFGVKKISFVDSINYPLRVDLTYLKTLTSGVYKFSNDSLEVESRKFSKKNTSIDLSDKFILISLSGDIKNVGEDKVPGPYFVASAIIDQLNNQFTIPSHNNIAVQLAMVLLFGLFVCLIFALLYKYVRKIQTKPYLISFLAFIFGLLLLFGFGYALLDYTIIRPAFPMLSMVWAALLAGHFAKKFLVTGVMEGGEIYDVFISYSHGDSSWVEQNLFNPLNEFKKPDGSKLNIFFDKKSIGIGELFTTKYMRGIVDSKLFVPIMSEEYYRKNHCRNEMDLAVKRHVEKLINICIITFDYSYVPEEFTNILLLDIKQQSDFMATLQKELVSEDQKEFIEFDSEEQTEFDQDESLRLEKKNKKEKLKKVKKRGGKKSNKQSDKKKQKSKKNKKRLKKIEEDKKRSAKKDKKKAKNKKLKQSKKKSKKGQKKKSKKSTEKDVIKKLMKKFQKHLKNKKVKKKKKKKKK